MKRISVNGRGTLTPGLRQAIKLSLTYNQIVQRHPWSVIVVRSGKRYRKRCTNIATAIELMLALKEKYGNATVVSRSRGYIPPPKLRGKIPKGWFWCAYCMNARKYRRVEGETFFAPRKVWSEDKNRYIFKERELALLECPVCGSTNRDVNFRRSNQPLERRKVKQGARRIKPRHRTKRQGNRIRVKMEE